MSLIPTRRYVAQRQSNSFDVLLVDEAHRLNEKSGLYQNLGDNQVAELIRSAQCAVFFVDDDQMVTLNDIGHSTELQAWARREGAEDRRAKTLHLTRAGRATLGT